MGQDTVRSSCQEYSKDKDVTISCTCLTYKRGRSCRVSKQTFQTYLEEKYYWSRCSSASSTLSPLQGSAYKCQSTPPFPPRSPVKDDRHLLQPIELDPNGLGSRVGPDLLVKLQPSKSAKNVKSWQPSDRPRNLVGVSMLIIVCWTQRSLAELSLNCSSNMLWEKEQKLSSHGLQLGRDIRTPWRWHADWTDPSGWWSEAWRQAAWPRWLSV